jgi:hypothetical protein
MTGVGSGTTKARSTKSVPAAAQTATEAPTMLAPRADPRTAARRRPDERLARRRCSNPGDDLDSGLVHRLEPLGQDRRQPTWWPALCGNARRARPRTPFPRPEPGCCADGAGCARLVAGYGPRAPDAGRCSLIDVCAPSAECPLVVLGLAWAEVTRDPHQNRSV